MMMVMHVVMHRGSRRRLGGNCLCTIRSRLGITRRLLYAARRSLGLRRSLLSALAGCFRAGGRLISPVGGIDCLLRRIRLIRATRHQGKGQYCPREPYQFRSPSH
jgi:hypothetical protein